MLARLFEQVRAEAADRAAIDGPTQQWTYAQLAAAARRVGNRLQPLAGQRVGVAISALAPQVATLLALDELDVVACLLPARSSREFARQVQRDLELVEVLGDEFAADIAAPPDDDAKAHPEIDPDATKESGNVTRRGGNGPGKVVLFTSGTSGPPKPAQHTWKSLAAAVHYGARYRGRRWLMTYDGSSFAGIQLWLQALLTGGALCIPPTGDLEQLARYLVASHVQFASGTPTFWRMLLGANPPGTFAGAAVEQITLGGEPVGQGVLDALHTTFPQAKLCHIYASTELGVCFSVQDGLAGFPRALLDEDSPGRCRMRIAADGQLEVQSARSMQGYLGEPQQQGNTWFATGDVVERRGDRVYFVGRRTGAINVGGSKVYPEEVEEVVRLVPGVCDARVSAVPSSLVGQLVGADVVPLPDADLPALRAAILAACRARLAKHKVPALIQFQASLAATGSGKLARTAT